jgi:hypothetical protein
MKVLAYNSLIKIIDFCFSPFFLTEAGWGMGASPHGLHISSKT